MSYDKNGNISSIFRSGFPSGNYEIAIDNLQFTNQGNQLTKVSDTSNNKAGFKDGNTIGDDYSYDANGNMIVDKNKGITKIVYNHLNLPTKITFSTAPTGNIVYIYNAVGQKVEKQVFTTSQGSVPSIIYYLNGFQYVFRENYADYVTKLQFFPTAEGYVKNTVVSGVNNYSYVYNYTDHLGNVRLSYQDINKDGVVANSEILEESNYYPFGMKHNGYNSGNLQPNYKYKYNGKELQDELGLNMYDYGARNYDPALGRWMNVDPLAEKYAGVSPYVYCINNPLIYVDPDGRDIIPVHGTWSNNKTWQDLKGITKASSNLFGDNKLGNSFGWSGGNYSHSRTEAAFGLIDHVRTQMKSKDFNGEITLVGHSHGGNVSIEALNMMAEMKEFDNVQLNLLTINTPVREDYQLSEKATGRVNHVNVYDSEDPVQSNGGKTLIILPDDPSNKKGTGEYGSAGRKFENAKNINVDNPQGLIEGHMMGIYPGDFHNSHNRTKDWIKKTENK